MSKREYIIRIGGTYNRDEFKVEVQADEETIRFIRAYILQTLAKAEQSNQEGEQE